MITFKDYLENLKTEMAIKRIKQGDLAKKLNSTQTNISLALNGKRGSIERYKKIEEAIKEWN